MSDEVNVKKKIVEEEIVEMKIEISKKLFEQIEAAKKDVAEKRGYDVTYGEYIEEAFDDFIVMIDQLGQKIQELSVALQYQQGVPQVVEREPEPGEKVPEEPAEPAPEQMYAHTDNRDINDPMFN